MFYIGIHRYCGNLFNGNLFSQVLPLDYKNVEVLPAKVSSIKKLLYRRQDKERRLKTNFHLSNNYLNNIVSSAYLLLQYLPGVPNVLVS